MNKVLLGLLLGAVLGAIDGGTAWFTPAVRSMMVGIVVGSTIKGLIAGVAAGVFARKVNSVPLGILFGLVVGFALAFLVAYMQHGYYFEIILPGSIVGMIVGYATQRPVPVSDSASVRCNFSERISATRGHAAGLPFVFVTHSESRASKRCCSSDGQQG